jgi:hypothetical protein
MTRLPGSRFNFSRLFRLSGISYADLPMTKPTTSKQLTAVWKTVPDPDEYALLKAVAMLFNRRVPLSTEPDLTSPDDTLMCERPRNP